MYDEKNFVYVLTILEAIEKIKIYSKSTKNKVLQSFKLFKIQGRGFIKRDSLDETK